MNMKLVLVFVQCMVVHSAIVPKSAENLINKMPEDVESYGPPISQEEFEEAAKMLVDEPMYEDGKDPLEGDLFEGDIMIEEGLTGRNGIIRTSGMWPGAVIPYVIDSSFSTNERATIANAMGVYQTKTCIQFVPKTSGHSNWIIIQAGNGCSSFVGRRRSGSQRVSLGRGCVHTGIVQHELMHAAGFYHEQSRYDRDTYITIDFSNVQSGLEGNFRKVSQSDSQVFGQSYDYGSVMHYGRTAFAVDRSKPTITPKQNGAQIGQRSGLSTVDVAKLNAMYQCSGNVTPTLTPTEIAPTTPKATCQDAFDRCPIWKNSGLCTSRSYVSFMTENCPKSCDLCPPPETC